MTETINYINKETGEEKIVTCFLSRQGKRSFCTVGRGDELKTFKTLEDAEGYLNKRGFVQKGFYDSEGVLRHSLSRLDLAFIQRAVDRLLANCTREESDLLKDSFVGIKVLIHKQMQEK